MEDYFNPAQARDELHRLKHIKAGLLNHMRFPIMGNDDLTYQEKTDLLDVVEEALDNAFFREINSLETDLHWHDQHVDLKQAMADVTDIRGRQ